ncbi:lysophospholipid acyltransferase family protein [Sabulicella glaciei]|uniref:Lysophospholipid acyltransferase family protein n=1 Tax=Sabulicella glaciei TaxID=2984948 RepID=A0ABT3NUN0_9PROT|nr:lysophospholipid acyltransferase family protein [Roseococcus sp. MDT2-1-1]
MSAKRGDDPVALRDERFVRFFDRAFSRFFARRMRALRVARWGMPEAPEGVPLVIFANHPSWWDGVSFLLLARRLFPGRQGFVPMDAAALARYGFMRRIGVFGIERNSARGAAAFLRTARTVLAHPSHMLWMNAPGRFSDARERPVPIAPGLSHLPEIAPGAVFLPLALEYPFWGERAAEALAAFGPPIPASELLALDRAARAERMRAALEAAMDRLAEDAIGRDPARFRALTEAQEGMGGIYGLWQRLRARLRGEAFDPRHDTDAPRES